MALLVERSPADMKLARIMLGVVPSCHPYLAIWPAALDTYALIVPNLLNMPFLLWGVNAAPSHLVSAVMYAASRAAGCMYCSAHSCTFGLRRGTPDDELMSATEALVGAVGRGLGTVPCSLTDAHRDALRGAYPPDVVEWLVLSAAMMGFLNKVMDALGVPLEQAVADRVGGLLTPTGWSHGHHRVEGEAGPSTPHLDSLATKLSVLPLLPRSLLSDMRLTRGIPSRSPAIQDRLRELCGYDFPVLRHLSHTRAIKAFGAAIRANVTASTSGVGLKTKQLAGLVVAVSLSSAELTRGCRAMATHAGGEAALDGVVAFARHATDLDDESSIAAALGALDAGLTATDRAALVVAKAAASSPANMTPLVLEQHAAKLSPAQTIELVVWLGIVQAMHRLVCFYDA